MNLHCRQNECLRFETANGNHSTIKLLQRKICRKFVENLPPLQRSSPTFLLQASINTNIYTHTHTDTQTHLYRISICINIPVVVPFKVQFNWRLLWIHELLLSCLTAYGCKSSLQVYTYVHIYIKLLVCRFVCTTYRNVRFIRCCVSIKYVCRYWCCLQVYFLGAINACWHWLRLSLWFRVGSLQHVF